MRDVGMKDVNPGADALVPVGDGLAQYVAGRPWLAMYPDPNAGRPVQMPRLPEGHVLFAGFDQGSGEKLLMVETLEDAQRIWDGYAVGGSVVPPKWYSAPVMYAEDN